MEGPTRKDRHRKNDDIVVLDGDNSTSLTTVKQEITRKRRKKDTRDEQEDERQSGVTSGNIEAQPVHSSPEVLELRQYLLMAKQAQINAEQIVINTAQQLLNTEGKLREAVLRADRAEKQLGSKQGGRDEQSWNELEAKVADLQKQLKKEKKRSDQRVSDLTDELEKEKQRSTKRVADLTKQLVEERSERRFHEFHLDERINQLTRQLSEANAAAAAVATNLTIHSVADKHNLFQLLVWGARHAISIDEGVKILRAAFEKCGKKAKERCREKNSTYDCEACDVKTPNKLVVITHFLSEEHIEKVRALSFNISRLAVADWKDMLDQLPSDGKSKQ